MEKVVERMKCGITIAWRRIVKNTFVAGFARRRTRSLQRGLMQITGVVQLYIVNRRRRRRCLTSGVHAGNGKKVPYFMVAYFLGQLVVPGGVSRLFNQCSKVCAFVL